MAGVASVLMSGIGTRSDPVAKSVDAAPADHLDAGRIVGLLADADRRRVLAAIELGAGTLGAVTSTTGLPQHRAAKALGKLIDGGLVATDTDDRFAVDGAAIARAARAARARRPSDEHADEPAPIRKVLDAFVHGGRIGSLPVSRAKRRVVLDWLARRFEPGRRYREADVTAMLDGHGEDAVTLRRYLVDEAFLDRAPGTYWRSGGSVPTS